MANDNPADWATEDDYIDATGHRVYKGSRWHYPAPGDPTRCGVTGCPRDLTLEEKRAEA